jgi:hypothetical protein
MYAPSVIDRREEAVLGDNPVIAALFPAGIPRYSVQECWQRMDRLKDAVDEEGTLIRVLTEEENLFIAGERIRVTFDAPYCLERYAWIDDSGHGLKPLFPLWESQAFLLRMLSKLEIQHIEEGHPDGLLLNVLKIRQVGITTLGVNLVAHRFLTRPYIRALVGSDMEAQAAYLFRMAERTYRNFPWWLKPKQVAYNKNREMMFDTHSELRTAWGKSTRGALQEVGGKKGNIERGRTYATFHISELATWDNPDQLDSALLPGIPVFRDTLGLLESTAELSDDWWHKHWRTSAAGTGRFRNLFIGNYAVPSKYSIPAPVGWSPSDSTKAWALKAEAESPQWCFGETIRPTKDQQYWYESTRAFYEAKDKLHEFLKEYPSDPEECFQYAGTSIFTIGELARIDEQAKSAVDIWAVEPAREIAELKRLDMTALQPDRRPPAPISARVSSATAEAQMVPQGYGFRRLGVDHLKTIEGVEGLRAANVLQIYEYPRSSRHPKGSSSYVMAVDVADGVGLDYSVIDLYRMPSVEEPTEQVAQFVSNTLKPVEIARIADAIGRLYVDRDGIEAQAAVESNIGPGIVVQSELQLHLGYTNFYVWETLDAGDASARFTKRIGWATTQRTRPIILARFYEGLTTKDPITGFLDLRLHSPISRAELRHLIIPKEPGARLGDAVAAPGHHDDCSMAGAIGNFVAYLLMGGETEPIHERRHRKSQLRALAAAPDGIVRDYRNSSISYDAMNIGADDDDDSGIDDEGSSLHFGRAYD